MNLSEAIVDFRTRMKISQREFARRCNLSHGTIALLEKGYNQQTGKKIIPDVETYKKIADGMEITMDRLLDIIDQSEMVSLGHSMTDQDRLEALHQNPRLGLLFDRARKMKPEDVEYMLRFATGILKERDGDD